MFAVIERAEGEYYLGDVPGTYTTIEVTWTRDLQLARVFKLTVEYKKGEEWVYDEPATIVADPPLPKLYAEWTKCRLRSISMELK